MGNCLRNSKISAQDHEAPVIEAKVEQIKTLGVEQSIKKKNKKVRFSIQNIDTCEGERGSSHHGNSRSGSVRIRVVMTQEELKRMLMCKGQAQHTSLEQLLDAVKLRGGRISEDGECHEGNMNSWTPSLVTIPEDRLINLNLIPMYYQKILDH
ncbi:hypothetical protein CR513_08712, partial [Mucuna pruriens]